MPTSPPSDLPGLGPKSLAMLAAAGIHGRADLERLGSVQAYLRVKAAGHDATYWQQSEQGRWQKKA